MSHDKMYMLYTMSHDKTYMLYTMSHDKMYMLHTMSHDKITCYIQCHMTKVHVIYNVT